MCLFVCEPEIGPKIIIHPLEGFIWTQHIIQLPVGLLAQLVERCTGIAKVMGSNPVRA